MKSCDKIASVLFDKGNKLKIKKRKCKKKKNKQMKYEEHF